MAADDVLKVLMQWFLGRVLVLLIYAMAYTALTRHPSRFNQKDWLNDPLVDRYLSVSSTSLSALKRINVTV